jgi:hypothetical protein
MADKQLYHAFQAVFTVRKQGMDQGLGTLLNPGRKPIRQAGQVKTQRRANCLAHTPLARRRETSKSRSSSPQLLDALHWTNLTIRRVTPEV